MHACRHHLRDPQGRISLKNFTLKQLEQWCAAIGEASPAKRALQVRLAIQYHASCLTWYYILRYLSLTTAYDVDACALHCAGVRSLGAAVACMLTPYPDSSSCFTQILATVGFVRSGLALAVCGRVLGSKPGGDVRGAGRAVCQVPGRGTVGRLGNCCMIHLKIW